MSLVGFKAQNHPQQQARPEVDDRAITVADFVPFNARFRFTVDAAASQQNARLPRYWTVDDDAFAQDCPQTGPSRVGGSATSSLIGTLLARGFGLSFCRDG
jgi:hypothetical protein